MKKFIFCALIALVTVLPVWSQEDIDCSAIPVAILLNCMPGFGVGSFIQGDTCGGTIQLAAEVVGVACVLIVMEVLSRTMTPEEKSSYMLPAIAVGILPAGAGIVFGFIRPVWYCYKRQQEQKVEALSVRISPTIAQSAVPPGFDIGVRLVIAFPIG